MPSSSSMVPQPPPPVLALLIPPLNGRGLLVTSVRLVSVQCICIVCEKPCDISVGVE